MQGARALTLLPTQHCRKPVSYAPDFSLPTLSQPINMFLALGSIPPLAPCSHRNLINMAVPMGNGELVCYPEEIYLHFNQMRSGDDVLIHISISALIVVYGNSCLCTSLGGQLSLFWV